MCVCGGGVRVREEEEGGEGEEGVIRVLKGSEGERRRRGARRGCGERDRDRRDRKEKRIGRKIKREKDRKEEERRVQSAGYTGLARQLTFKPKRHQTLTSDLDWVFLFSSCCCEWFHCECVQKRKKVKNNMENS